MKYSVALVALLAVALAPSGCGGSDGGDEPANTVSSTPSPVEQSKGKVTLSRPRDNAKVNTQSIAIVGKVVPPDAQVAVNNFNLSGQYKTVRPSGDGRFHTRITLRQGDNFISADLRDAPDDSGAVELTVTRERSDETETTKVTSRAKAIAKVRNAAKTLKQQGARAASNLAGVSEDDLLPSEKGADLLVRRGYIEEKRFCNASDVLLTAEDDELLLKPDYFADHPEDRDSKPFEAGWNKAAPEELQGVIGAALYNALWTRCLKP